jgi:hypothetical protein
MLGFDLNEVTPDQIDQFQKTGGLLPAGKYHVRLDGAKDTNSKNMTPGEELHFTVVGGPFAGHEIKETLWKSDKDGSKNRLVLFASRLGLVRRDGARFVPVEGKHSFSDCLGAECVIEVEHESYENKTTGKKGTAVRVSFGGIWRVDDPAVKSVQKGKAGVAAPTKKKVDTSEL